MSNPDVSHGPGGTMYAGPDAMSVVRATYLVSGLRLYAKSKMLLTRNATPTAMLAMATGFTGKKYKRGQYEQAADDVKVWSDLMKSGLQVEVRE